MTMKQKAQWTFGLTLLAFAAAVWLRHVYPDSVLTALFLFMAEASVIGGIADWYAVTALFRSPLGIRSIPHTAIIPRNRDKLIQGVAQLVENELLSPASLRNKVREVHLVDGLVGWVDRMNEGKPVTSFVWVWLARFLSQVDAGKTAETLSGQVLKRMQQTDVTPYAARLLRYTLEQGEIHVWLDRLLDEVSTVVGSVSMRLQIRSKLEQIKEEKVNEGGWWARTLKRGLASFAEKANAVDLDDAARQIHADVRALLADMRRKDHPMRLLVIDMLEKLAADLGSRSEVSAAVERWKTELLAGVSLKEPLEALLRSLVEVLIGRRDIAYVIGQEEQTLTVDELKSWIDRFADTYWAKFKEDQTLRDWLEGYAQEFVTGIIESEYQVIRQIVRETLDRFTEQKLIAFIESKVGPDLQRIRINGSLIGGLAGGLLFLFLRYVYDPVLAALLGA